jgi:hypothetical protein
LQPNMHISQTEYRKNFVVYNSYPKLKSGAKGTHEGTLNNIIVYIKFHDDPNFINSGVIMMVYLIAIPMNRCIIITKKYHTISYILLPTIIGK